ncbi:MAG: TIGR00730 family Rossman fold protein [Candidatus Hydrogenedentota bacterium]
MINSVCIFGASSMTLSESYLGPARALGRLMGEQGIQLVFGGGQHGIMGAVAEGVHERGGSVLGIIPDKLDKAHISYAASDEWIVTEDLRDRKAIMQERSDAYIVLPGGFGTLDELMESLSMKQLDFHRKPIILLNTNGFFDALHAFFDHMIAENCLRNEHLGLMQWGDTPGQVIALLQSYVPITPTDKYSS